MIVLARSISYIAFFKIITNLKIQKIQLKGRLISSEGRWLFCSFNLHPKVGFTDIPDYLGRLNKIISCRAGLRSDRYESPKL